MKILGLIFCFCLIASIVSAEQYYVFIDKIGVVYEGEEAGQNEYGDVIGIYPYTTQYKPTRAELSRYKVLVMGLTDEERLTLTESEVGVVDINEETGEKIYMTIRARKHKIDIDKLDFNQEQEVDKTEVFKKLILKPSLITP